MAAWGYEFYLLVLKVSLFQFSISFDPAFCSSYLLTLSVSLVSLGCAYKIVFIDPSIFLSVVSNNLNEAHRNSISDFCVLCWF